MKSTTCEAAVQVESLLRLADGALVLGQRLSECCGHGPVLEEDIALTNIALDLIGQARLLLTHAGALEGRGRDEDQLAFLRAPHEFRNPTLVEQPNGDFAQIVVRNTLYTAFQAQLWPRLQDSADAELAAIAAKSAKETRYHLQHAADWLLRLGDGTAESQQRAQAALDLLWPYTAELFADDAVDEAVAAAGIAPLPSALQADWLAAVRAILAEATLREPERGAFRSHGRQGRHSEHLGHLLAPMQYLQRAYPGAQW